MSRLSFILLRLFAFVFFSLGVLFAALYLASKSLLDKPFYNPLQGPFIKSLDLLDEGFDYLRDKAYGIYKYFLIRKHQSLHKVLFLNFQLFLQSPEGQILIKNCHQRFYPTYPHKYLDLQNFLYNLSYEDFCDIFDPNDLSDFDSYLKQNFLRGNLSLFHFPHPNDLLFINLSMFYVKALYSPKTLIKFENHQWNRFLEAH